MSVDKRKRLPNWLLAEKELLLSLAKQHYKIIENKKTDGASMKAKLAQWRVIADQYNSQTMLHPRSAENLKNQWESLKKAARKEASNSKKNLIVTSGRSLMPAKMEDNFLQRVYSIVSSSAVRLCNSYDSDSVVPSTQDQQAASDEVKREFPETPPAEKQSSSISSGNSITDNEKLSDTDMLCDPQELLTQVWVTPMTSELPVTNTEEKYGQNEIPTHRTWVPRRKPATKASFSLEQLYKHKIEAIELQNKLAVDEAERSKVLHDLDIKIKKQVLQQEKLKTSLLFIRRRKLLNLTKSKPS